MRVDETRHSRKKKVGITECRLGADAVVLI